MQSTIRILHVEDDALDRELIRTILEKEHGGFEVTEAASRDDFVTRLTARDFDLVLTDFDILGFEGLQVIDHVREVRPALPVVVVTGTGSEEIAVEAMKRGAADYVIKTPRHIQRLPKIIGAVLENRRLQAELGQTIEALRESEEKYRLLFTHEKDAILLVDRETLRVLDANAAALAAYGCSRDELLNRGFLGLSADPERTRIEVDRTEVQWHRRKDGSVFPVEASFGAFVWRGHPVLCAIVRDITERRSLELQLRQSQKMEAVGRLAGGIAHDFNNLLTAILGHASLVQLPSTDESERMASVRQIEAAARRAAGLTRQLLSFARKQVVHFRVVVLNELVERTTEMLQRLIGENIELETRVEPRPWPVAIDPGQFEQVLLNLALNARDAMPRGGRLVIRTENRDPASGSEPPLLQDSTQPHVVLSVTDDGCGMSEEVVAHVFEPFFTTKESGKGTGLGLATCYGIVKQAGGDIRIDSEPGAGTTVSIGLPRAEGEPGTTLAQAEAPTQLSGKETVLVVEDHDSVRDVAVAVLKRGGYRVLAAASGRQALDLAQAHPGPIDMLLSDIVLPGMNGPETARQLRLDRPAIKVLFMTGYAESSTLDSELVGTAEVLQKPFTPQALGEKVRRVLDG